MTREELRDKVARAIGESLRTARMSLESEGYLPEADAAIALVLEEAAKVASRMYRKGQIGPDIAAAIRALIPSEEPPGAS